MVETVLSRSVRLICAGGMLLGMQMAYAQEAAAPIQRVEVTGSSIKRIAAEASLPIQTFNQKDIARTGVTSVTDFLQQLPVMQGFTVAADAVGGGGGITTASIHDVGEQYTLVLINGRRLAPANSGTTIDVNSIPLAAVERIEVLTDGASALYGADAIAGVVNFILKKGASPLTVEAKLTRPQHPGARGKSFSIAKGFGDMESDGYSLFLSYSHQQEDRLKGSQRDFAKTGIINFRDPKTGRDLQFFNGSGRSIPPNVQVFYQDGGPGPEFENSVNVNPYLQLKGHCAPAHVDLGDGNCYFDYTSTVEIAPELKRDGFYASGSIKLGDSGFKAFADVALNKSHIYANIAPYPAEFAMAPTAPLFLQYVAPYLTPYQLANATTSVVKYRLSDMGGRAYDYASTTHHVVAGVDGTAGGWDVNGAFTYSKNKSPQNYVGGFPLAAKFDAAIAAGTINPFPYAQGEMPQTMIDALKATGFSGNYNTTTIEMKGADARASREMFSMAGGKASLGVGADFRTTSYSEIGNPAVSHSEILFDSDQPSFDYSRKNAGAYAEMLLPVIKNLDITGSLRYDTIGKIDDRLNNVTVGKNQHATTYKLSARFQPSKEMLFRAAYGTGFRVATMKEIGQPITDFGVTGGSYPCPIVAPAFTAADPLFRYCVGVPTGQLEAFNGGNSELKPEKSKQWSIGAVFEPNAAFSAKFDFWNVEITDAVTSVSERLIATFPQKYYSLYMTKHKASTNRDVLAILFAPINIGKAENQGLDYDLLYKMKVSDVKLTGRLAGTHLLKSRYTEPGTDDVWHTSLGEYGTNDAVSFRNIVRASLTADAGKWTHNLAMNYRSGYKDVHYTVADCAVSVGDANGPCADVQLDVKAYTTFDWQTQFRLMQNLELTAGIINMADKEPPLSLRSAGSHQLGYDPRYASPVGRTFYLSGNYKF